VAFGSGELEDLSVRQNSTDIPTLPVTPSTAWLERKRLIRHRPPAACCGYVTIRARCLSSCMQFFDFVWEIGNQERTRFIIRSPSGFDRNRPGDAERCAWRRRGVCRFPWFVLVSSRWRACAANSPPNSSCRREALWRGRRRVFVRSISRKGFGCWNTIRSTPHSTGSTYGA